MKAHLIIVIAMLMLAGCRCLQRDPCLWAIGKEAEILKEYNNQLDSFFEKYKGNEFYDPVDFTNRIANCRAKLIEVHPSGKKMRVTRIKGGFSPFILEQDEYNYGFSYRVKFAGSKLAVEKSVYSGSHCKPLIIKIMKEDF